MNFDINNIHSKLSLLKEEKAEDFGGPEINSLKLKLPNRFYTSLTNPKKTEKTSESFIEENESNKLSFKKLDALFGSTCI